jgi:membrane protease YdiL (CAAX protease family)
MSLRFLDPRQILVVLDEIDDQWPSWSLTGRAALRQIFFVLASVSICLLLLNYAKNGSSLHLLLLWMGEWLHGSANHYVGPLRNSGWYDLVVYCWWTGWHLVSFLLLPWLVIRYLLGLRMGDMALRWNETTEHWRGYVLLLSPILVFVVLVSFGEDFVDHYPFYRYANRSWFDFLAWQMLYMSQFVVLEFFFRGYVVNALRPAVGANAIWIMCVPYLMIHFPKLWLEATGAILFGLFLGILALRSRSIWGGVLVHAGVALSMDVAALLRKGGLPDIWWPF